MPRATQRYESVREEPSEIVAQMKQLAQDKPRYGYRRLQHIAFLTGRRTPGFVGQTLVIRHH